MGNNRRRKLRTRNKTSELLEDAYLARIAAERIATFNRKEALTHEQVWGGLANRRKNKKK